MAGNMKVGVGGYGIDVDSGRRVFGKDIDANEKRAGDFTEAVTIGGKQAFLTKAGKEGYDKLQNLGGFRFSLDTDYPFGLFSKEQAYTGNTK